MARKLTEERLYKVWLDIWYAVGDSTQALNDAAMAIKDLRRSNRKNIKLLARAADHYEELNGRPPMEP